MRVAAYPSVVSAVRHLNKWLTVRYVGRGWNDTQQWQNTNCRESRVRLVFIFIGFHFALARTHFNQKCYQDSVCLFCSPIACGWTRIARKMAKDKKPKQIFLLYALATREAHAFTNDALFVLPLNLCTEMNSALQAKWKWRRTHTVNELVRAKATAMALVKGTAHKWKCQ